MVGQHDVHQRQVRRLALGEVLQCLPPIGGVVDHEAVTFEHVADEKGDVLFVFHHENAFAGGFAHG